MDTNSRNNLSDTDDKLRSIQNQNQPKAQTRRQSIEFRRKNGPIKSCPLGHWRSPSNPVDWCKNVWSVNTPTQRTKPIGADNGKKANFASQPNTPTTSAIQSNNLKSLDTSHKIITQALPNLSSSNQPTDKSPLYPAENINFLSVIGCPRTPNKTDPPAITTPINNRIKFKASVSSGRHYKPLVSSPLVTNNCYSVDNLMTAQELQAEREAPPLRLKSPFKYTQDQAIKNIWQQSYELTLLKCPSVRFHGNDRFPLLAEITISPVVGSGASDFSGTRRFAFAFEASYCGSPADHDDFSATSLGFGMIDPVASDFVFARNSDRFLGRANLSLTSASQAFRKLTFSRSCLVQCILRNPQDGAVADIFVLKLDLCDMPANSRTILRQKVYKTCLDEDGQDSTYLSKMIELPLVRTYDQDAKRQRIRPSGPIRVAFSFNRSNLRYTCLRRGDNGDGVERAQKTHTILQFPSAEKYFSLRHAPSSKEPTSSTQPTNPQRFSQHGSLCL